MRIADVQVEVGEPHVTEFCELLGVIDHDVDAAHSIGQRRRNLLAVTRVHCRHGRSKLELLADDVLVDRREDRGGTGKALLVALANLVEDLYARTALVHKCAVKNLSETAMSAVQHSRCTVRSSLSGSRTENKPPKLAPELERDIDMRLAISESEEARGAACVVRPLKLALELERDIDMRLEICESEEARGAACVVRPLKLTPELERDIDMRFEICESEEARGAACVVRPLKLAPELERDIDMRLEVRESEEARGAACGRRSWHLSSSGTSTCGSRSASPRRLAARPASYGR